MIQGTGNSVGIIIEEVAVGVECHRGRHVAKHPLH